MIWQYIRDFMYLMLEGSYYAGIISDLTAVLFTCLLTYAIIIIPLQFIIRSILSIFAELTQTKPFWTKWSKRKRQKKPFIDI